MARSVRLSLSLPVTVALVALGGVRTVSAQASGTLQATVTVVALGSPLDLRVAESESRPGRLELVIRPRIGDAQVEVERAEASGEAARRVGIRVTVTDP